MNELLERHADDAVVLEHPTGTFAAAVELRDDDGTPIVERAGIVRTAGKLMDGIVFPRRYHMSATTIPGPAPRPAPADVIRRPTDACDAHCHIFGPGDRFPFAADRAYTPPDSGIDDFQALQERLGLSCAVFVQASCHGTDNSAMVDAIERGAGRYAGVAMIDESFSDADIGRLHDVGVRGTRFNFVAHLGGAPELDVFWRIVDRVVPYGWHIVLHFDAKDLPSYADLLDRMPCPFVIDHMARVPTSGGLDQEPFRALLDVMADERAWVKISGAERLTADGPPVRRRRPLRPGADRRGTRPVLWGTDWPHPNVRHMPDDGDLVDLLASFAPDEATRNRILVTIQSACTTSRSDADSQPAAFPAL